MKAKHTANWSVQIAGMIFQARSKQALLLYNLKSKTRIYKIKKENFLL